ncbi:MAG: STAS domain-containing protein [Acidiferrobacteraceae bacterium]
MSGRIESSGTHGFRVIGEITFETAKDLDGFPGRWGDLQQVDVDFSEAEEIDSAAAALMLDWVNIARASGRALRFTGVPARLQDLIRVYGLTPLLDAVIAR